MNHNVSIKKDGPVNPDSYGELLLDIIETVMCMAVTSRSEKELESRMNSFMNEMKKICERNARGAERYVIYAVPGKELHLLPIEEALNQFPTENGELVFNTFEIAENLQLCYQDQNTWESEDEFTILAPVMIQRISRDHVGEIEDMPSADYFKTVDFLTVHSLTVTDQSGATVRGWWVPKN